MENKVSGFKDLLTFNLRLFTLKKHVHQLRA